MKDAITIDQLPREFLRRAQACRDDAFDKRGAKIWTAAAAMVRQALQRHADDLLTPAEAEAEGLGDRETIARKLRDGRLPNHGRKHAPKVRRGDLERRTRLTVVAAVPDEGASIDDDELARAAIRSRSGGGR